MTRISRGMVSRLAQPHSDWLAVDSLMVTSIGNRIGTVHSSMCVSIFATLCNIHKIGVLSTQCVCVCVCVRAIPFALRHLSLRWKRSLFSVN